jgi:hypothetical protein
MRTRRFSNLCAAGLITLLLAASQSPAASAGTIEGRWRLVEQTYGTDGSDLMRSATPVRLEFTRGASGTRGRVWTKDDEADGKPWPVLPLAATTARMRSSKVEVTPAADRVQASYSVVVPEDPELVLEIVEAYEIGDDDATLTGTVTVGVIRGGEPAGSYTLHRRFERQP